MYCNRALGLLASKFSTSSQSPNPPSTTTTIPAQSTQGLPPTTLANQSTQGLPPTTLAVNQLLDGLQQLLSRNATTHKIVCSLIVTFWNGCPKELLLPQLNSSLVEQGGYEELMPFLLALQKDCHVCVAFCVYVPDILSDCVVS